MVPNMVCGFHSYHKSNMAASAKYTLRLAEFSNKFVIFTVQLHRPFPSSFFVGLPICDLNCATNSGLFSCICEANCCPLKYGVINKDQETKLNHS